MKYVIVSSNYYGEIQEVIGPFDTHQAMSRWVEEHKHAKRFAKRTWVYSTLTTAEEVEAEL